LPREIWKYWLRKTVLPNSATPTNRLANVASAVLRSRNSRSGMMGSAARASRQTRQGQQQHSPAHHQGGRGRAPGELVAGERDPDEQGAHPADDEGRAEVVDAHPFPAYDGQVQGLLQHDEGQQRERRTHEEAPPPAQP